MSVPSLKSQIEYHLAAIDAWRKGERATPGMPATGQRYGEMMLDQIKEHEIKLIECGHEPTIAYVLVHGFADGKRGKFTGPLAGQPANLGRAPTKTKYRIATMPYIGSQAVELYNLENKVGITIEKLAGALVPYIERVDGRDINPDKELYQTLVPEALAGILNKYDHRSALAAILGYLRKELGAEIEILNRIKSLAEGTTTQELHIVVTDNHNVREIDFDNMPPKGRG